MPSALRLLLLTVTGATLASVLAACGATPSDRVDLASAPSVPVTPPATQTPARSPVPTGARPSPSPAVVSPARPPVAARTKTNPPARSRSAVAASGSVAGKVVWGLGDSVMLGAKPLFAARRWRVDAKVGRQFSAGVPILRRYLRSGAMPRNVVVSLGTNGTVSLADCRAMVTASGPSRQVFLVNGHAARSWIPGNNRTIRRCAASFSRNRPIVVDWATPAAGHPGWFGRDGIHPNVSGRRNYMSLIVAAVARSGL